MPVRTLRLSDGVTEGGCRISVCSAKVVHTLARIRASNRSSRSLTAAPHRVLRGSPAPGGEAGRVQQVAEALLAAAAEDAPVVEMKRTRRQLQRAAAAADRLAVRPILPAPAASMRTTRCFVHVTAKCRSDRSEARTPRALVGAHRMSR